MAATKSHGHILLTKISDATEATKINVTKLIGLKIDERFTAVKSEQRREVYSTSVLSWC